MEQAVVFLLQPVSMGKKDAVLEEAPVFHPTEEEFKDALHYIASIRAQAEPYGLCRIVPPDSWRPPFALPDKWRFPTKVQKVHHLQERQGRWRTQPWGIAGLVSWETRNAVLIFLITPRTLPLWLQFSQHASQVP